MNERAGGRRQDDAPVGSADIRALSASELARLMRDRNVSPLEVVQAFLDRIGTVNPSIHAVVTLRAEGAMGDAKRSERAIAEGRAGALEGLPFTVKDTIETKGVRTTAGSRVQADVVPNVNAPAVTALIREGAILLGKTNAPEFALAYSTDNALFGRTRNPWNPELTPGGSSGGEGAIIAARGSPIGLGTDLGGSIRIPAAFCRIAGLRPSRGRFPQGGQVPPLPGPLGQVSVVGPMASSAEDIALIMSAVSPGWRDQVPDQDTRIAYYEQDGVVPAAASQREAVKCAAEALAVHFSNVEAITPPWLDSLYHLWDEIWIASGGTRGLLADYIDDESALSPGLARLVAVSPPGADPARLEAAAGALDKVKQDAAEFMTRFPVVVCPVAAGPASERAGQWTIDGIALKGARGFGYCYVWSLVGCPALTVSWTSDDDETAAVQVIARPDHDEEPIGIGRVLERALSRGLKPIPMCQA
jgi:amidase